VSVDLSATAIEARLREASRRAGPLTAESRLSTKVDLSPAGVTARLREAAQLLALCQALGRAGSGQGGASSPGTRGRAP
jgi:hypothetical protein